MTRPTVEELEAMGLTEEERQALLEDDNDTESEDDEDEASTDDGADEGEHESGGDDAGSDDDGDDDAESEEAEGDDAEEDGAEGGSGEAEARQRSAPILTAEDPGDAEERLTEIATEKEKLIEQFDDGELTAKEYQLELDKLAKQEREIEQELFRANIARDMAEQQARNEWLATVNTFLDANPRYRESQLMHQTLDMTVRALASQEENQSMTGAEILEKAHGLIAAEFGLQEEQKVKDGSGKKPGRKTINAPPTLAHVPASDITETSGNRWSKLDRLIDTDPERYEAELAKLSDSDRESYLTAH